MTDDERRIYRILTSRPHLASSLSIIGITAVCSNDHYVVTHHRNLGQCDCASLITRGHEQSFWRTAVALGAKRSVTPRKMDCLIKPL